VGAPLLLLRLLLLLRHLADTWRTPRLLQVAKRVERLVGIWVLLLLLLWSTVASW
jgi:hypothetical protein